ncbi:hypothetical protein JCM8208_001953 [Rhodotorula glutinis]
MATSSTSTQRAPTVVSCPGKVFLAGGYLVLDRAHQGYVVATPSRFFTVVSEPQQREQGAAHDDDRFAIEVVSPQFDDGRWRYEARRVDGEWTVEEDKSQGSASNSFVYLSVRAALQVASALNPSASFRPLEVTVVGSNDFYSQSRTDTPIPFAPLHCTIRDVHKTGLGSSAAMVTSLTSALVLHWTAPADASGAPTAEPEPAHGRLPNPDAETVELLHNLAQYVHSLAQGKVGSGFDVSTAIYGSQTYRRFAVECLGDLLSPESSRESTITGTDLLAALSPSRNAAWTAPSTAGSVSSFALPPNTVLVLADVDAGSNTPSMVGKVLGWKKANPDEAERVWNDLGESNGRLRDSFEELGRRATQDREGYEREVARLAGLPASEWTTSTMPFPNAVNDILTIRKHIRHMGAASGVPIEPPEQTELLDACSALPGVVGAGVPGAGGYDAIWVLCLAPPPSSSSSSASASAATAPSTAVEALLRSYTAMSVGPLSRTAWAQGGTVEGEKGLLRERVGEVEGLREAVERGRR